MNGEPQRLTFTILVWTLSLGLGALHLTESSALSDGPATEPFTPRPPVLVAQAKSSPMTPGLSHSSRGARVKRFESRLKKFFYEPLGNLLGEEPTAANPPSKRKV
jgi:hypothetical protein